MTAPTSPVMQKRNAEMTALASSDLLSVDDKNAAIEVYDATGGASFTLMDDTVVTLDNVRFPNHFPEVFEIAADVVTVLEYGLYTFYSKVTVEQAGGSSQGGLVAWVEEDPDTGVWQVLTASETYFTIASISSAKASATFTFTKKSEPGFRYRLKVSQFYGSSPFATVALMSHLGIIRLFKIG